LICRDRRIGGKTERLYVLHDHFNVTAIIDVNGTVLERYGFDGFGAPRYMDASFGARSSSNYGWETLFGAYRYDADTGLYQPSCQKELAHESWSSVALRLWRAFSIPFTSFPIFLLQVQSLEQTAGG
jgi:hypothetical protein